MNKDIKICEYSGLRPVEGYKEEKTSPQDIPAIEDNIKAIDKKEEIKKGDIDFMYKWIKEKSGK